MQTKIKNVKSIPVQINNIKIEAEIAKTLQEKSQGLSGRILLEQTKGMLFIFDQPGFYGFWMKDMNFPIDIIWIDQNRIIVDITENLFPATFPKSFQPKSPAKYVLEVNAGFADKNKIVIGDAVKFDDLIK